MNNVKVRHKKTGNIYDVERLSVINCTNANDGQLMVLYHRNGLHFVREQTEFFKKFENVNQVNLIAEEWKQELKKFIDEHIDQIRNLPKQKYSYIPIDLEKIKK